MSINNNHLDFSITNSQTFGQRRLANLPSTTSNTNRNRIPATRSPRIHTKQAAPRVIRNTMLKRIERSEESKVPLTVRSLLHYGNVNYSMRIETLRSGNNPRYIVECLMINGQKVFCYEDEKKQFVKDHPEINKRYVLDNVIRIQNSKIIKITKDLLANLGITIDSKVGSKEGSQIVVRNETISKVSIQGYQLEQEDQDLLGEGKTVWRILVRRDRIQHSLPPEPVTDIAPYPYTISLLNNQFAVWLPYPLYAPEVNMQPEQQLVPQQVPINTHQYTQVQVPQQVPMNTHQDIQDTQDQASQQVTKICGPLPVQEEAN